jgi:hypothetical protein
VAEDKATQEFREEQKATASAQGLDQDHAVPESRPQAFLSPSGAAESALTQRMREEGALPSDEPMPKSAYDAAADETRQKKTAQQGRKEAAHIGTVVRVLSGPHRDRQGAVLRVVSYPTIEDRMRKAAGNEDSDYIAPKEVEVSFRGDGRDGERTVLNLEDIDYEVLRDFEAFKGRANVIGSL